jgi:uncharacterized protein YebE (UPF0316 family)
MTLLSVSFDYYSWIILPVLIFLSRIGDVTLGTLRHVFISKGYKSIVPLLGFFEVLIWIIVVAQVMKHLDNWMCYLGWAGGFAAGTYIGLLIEERLALGLQIIRIITNQDCEKLLVELKEKNHGVTIIEAQGALGPVKVILSIVSRTNIVSVIRIINKNNPTAFYSVEDIRDKGQGVFTSSKNSSALRRILSVRK